MKAVIQEETTGCGIAAVATLVQLPYKVVKENANSIGIFAEDEKLFSDTKYVHLLLSKYGYKASGKEIPFQSWEALPDLALISIKCHIENDRLFWHWVVFYRENGKPVVLDSAAYLKENQRTDFKEMQPKWYIEVIKT